MSEICITISDIAYVRVSEKCRHISDKEEVPKIEFLNPSGSKRLWMKGHVRISSQWKSTHGHCVDVQRTCDEQLPPTANVRPFESISVIVESEIDRLPTALLFDFDWIHTLGDEQGKA